MRKKDYKEGNDGKKMVENFSDYATKAYVYYN